jgi:D-alanyl-D-alanine dipeptidase
MMRGQVAGKACVALVAAVLALAGCSISPVPRVPSYRLEALRADALRAQPPEETGDFRATDLVEVTRLDPSIRLDVRYATNRNFLHWPVYSEPRVFLQRPAAEAVVRAQRALQPQGYGLVLYDGYRPWYVTMIFWDAVPLDRHDYVADPAQGSKHNRGCAVDLGLVELGTGRPVPMPSDYDEFTERAHPDYAGGTAAQRAARDLLRRTMEAEGFTVDPGEWWHYDCQDWRHYRIGNVAFKDVATR